MMFLKTQLLTTSKQKKNRDDSYRLDYTKYERQSQTGAGSELRLHFFVLRQRLIVMADMSRAFSTLRVDFFVSFYLYLAFSLTLCVCLCVRVRVRV